MKKKPTDETKIMSEQQEARQVTDLSLIELKAAMYDLTAQIQQLEAVRVTVNNRIGELTTTQAELQQ